MYTAASSVLSLPRRMLPGDGCRCRRRVAVAFALPPDAALPGDGRTSPGSGERAGGGGGEGGEGGDASDRSAHASRCDGLAISTASSSACVTAAIAAVVAGLSQNCPWNSRRGWEGCVY